MACNWMKNDYFSELMLPDKRSHTALEMLVDDLHTEKEKTIGIFLCHSGSEDFLWGLVRLLGSDISRVAGNAAYIIGTLAESDLGCYRILALAKSKHPESRRILPDLTNMLTFEDAESVMNAAGTMGTLAESPEGREWVLSEPCLGQTISYITTLLHTENLWTASNAALVLARLSISEDGCSQILQHKDSEHILSRLVQSLGVDEAGRGMNAAFSIGRICDMEEGRKRLLSLSESERMVSCLAKMLSCEDTGASKNACFALSCLATSSEGHARLLSNVHSDEILKTLAELLGAEDSETGWFAAMTLRTLACQPKGCLRIRSHTQIITALKAVEQNPTASSDLKEEASTTLDIVKKLEKAAAPLVQVKGANIILASWLAMSTKSGLPVSYQLHDGNKVVYSGHDLQYELTGLLPNMQYTFKVRACTEGDESPFSDPVMVTTEEAAPDPPQHLHVIACTISQLKVGWDPPEIFNGVSKGYYVYVGEKMVEHTFEQTAIISGLAPSTSHEIQVCAATARGKGERSFVSGTTAEIGAHAPSKPQVTVMGRNEVHLAWEPPEVPLGRITRYDVITNGKCVYSGTDLSYTVHRLTPDTEYSFIIVALTNEGKFESKPTKKRTAKDEYEYARVPLYQPPKREPIVTEDSQKPPPTMKKRKSLPGSQENKARSAKSRSGTPSKERSKTPSAEEAIKFRSSRPPSATSAVTSTNMDVTPTSQQSNTTSLVEQPITTVSAPGFEIRTAECVRPTKPEDSYRAKPDVMPYKMFNEIPRKLKAQMFPSQRPMPKPYRNIIAKASFPFSLSHVSLYGSANTSENKSQPQSLPQPQEEDITLCNTLMRTSTFSEPVTGSNKNLKLDRSKTTIIGRDASKNKIQDNKVQKSFDKVSIQTDKTYAVFEQKSQLFEKIRTSKFSENIGYHSTQSAETKPSLTEKISSRRVETDVESYAEMERHRTPRVYDSDLRQYLHDKTRLSHSSRDLQSTRVSRQYASNVFEKNPLLKDPSLPKPSAPSQDYLEGTPLHHQDAVRFSKSRQSPTHLQDLNQLDFTEVDWLTRRFLDLPNDTPSNLLAPSGHPADSSYVLDNQRAYLQRTNTYINSHRPRRVVERPQGKSQALANSETLSIGPPVDPRDCRPSMPRSSNKFVPMQLRTQPSNLPPSQLQRVNTTLGDSKAFRRFDAMARSQTNIGMRQPHPVPIACMPIHGPHARHDPGTLAISSHKIFSKDRSTPPKKSTSHTSQRLTRSAQQKEPDSILLGKNWAQNSSTEATLQTARC